MWYTCHVICDTHAAFIAVFHGPSLSSGRYERKYNTCKYWYKINQILAWLLLLLQNEFFIYIKFSSRLKLVQYVLSQHILWIIVKRITRNLSTFTIHFKWAIHVQSYCIISSIMNYLSGLQRRKGKYWTKNIGLKDTSWSANFYYIYILTIRWNN